MVVHAMQINLNASNVFVKMGLQEQNVKLMKVSYDNDFFLKNHHKLKNKNKKTK